MAGDVVPLDAVVVLVVLDDEAGLVVELLRGKPWKSVCYFLLEFLLYSSILVVVDK